MCLYALAADELPKELLLHCEGQMNAVMDVPTPQSRSATFTLNLRLQDGSITDTQTGVIEGTIGGGGGNTIGANSLVGTIAGGDSNTILPDSTGATETRPTR